jgi:hypothetical protein
MVQARHSFELSRHISYAHMQKLTLIQINTPHKTNMHPQPPMTPTALQTAKCTHGQRSRRSTGRGNDERGPSGLAFWTVAADLIFGEGHKGFEASFEIGLGHDCGLLGGCFVLFWTRRKRGSGLRALLVACGPTGFRIFGFFLA